MSSKNLIKLKLLKITKQDTGYLPNFIYLILARLSLAKGHHQLAASFYGKVLGYKAMNHSRHNYKYAYTLFTLGRLDEALEHINRSIITLNRKSSDYLILRAKIFIALKRYLEAENDLQDVLTIDDSKALPHYILGVALATQKRWWQAEESFQSALSLGYKSAKFYRRFGQASFEMKHYSTAEKMFLSSAKLWNDNNPQSNRAELYYMAGLSGELDGNKNFFKYYQKAIELDNRLNSKMYGIGIFHEQTHMYDMALKEYEKTNKDSGQLNHAYALYAYGRLLGEIGEAERALGLLNRALDLDYTNHTWHRTLGYLYSQQGDHTAAAKCFKDAVDRSDEFDVELIILYADELSKIGDLIGCGRILNLIKVLYSNSSIADEMINETTAVSEMYAVMCDTLPIQNKTILYESMHAVNFGDNPAAILRYLLRSKDFTGYKHVVVVNDKLDAHHELKKHKNVILVTKGTFLYAYYLAISSHVINNTSFPTYFIRRVDQKYLNTWHGTPWKTLGIDVAESYVTIGNIQRNFLQATHMISPNNHTSYVMLDRYDIADIFPGKIAETGYPRNDIVVNISNQRIIQLKKELDLDPTKKVVFYAPTWRGVVGDEKDQTARLVSDIVALTKLDCLVLFRGHYFNSGVDKNVDVLVEHSVPDNYSTNELMAISDVLVTDYSSVLFDFMITRRPIVYYLYDYDNYKLERGLYFEHDELPGEKAFTRHDLVEKVKKTLTTSRSDNDYSNAINRFCPHDDGRATERVVNFFFNGDNSCEVQVGNGKLNLLFYLGSFLSNGITSSGINLLNNIDKNKYNVHVLIDPKNIFTKPDRVDHLSKLDDHVRIISRMGPMTQTRTEKEVIKRYNACKPLSEFESLLQKGVYNREFRRLFGESGFTRAIDYDGYSRIFVALFASDESKRNGCKNIIYMHSMIYDEYLNKHPHLILIFKLYQSYDRLISVSKSTYLKNKEDLAQSFEIADHKFDYIDNVQDPDLIVSQANEPLSKDEEKLFESSITTFITVGRLSVEKDQQKLIKAFKLVKNKHKDTSLVIIGDGPMKYRLKNLIDELGLSKSVHMLGQQSNPFKFVAHADCFVLSSNYEGQGMVIYEAFTLNKPVISTDNGASKAILSGGYGELSDNSIEGLTTAMNKYIEGSLNFKRFDIEKYNTDALQSFYSKVIDD